MSHRLTNGNLIPGSHILNDGSYGVLAENIPSTGNNGSGYIFPSLNLPGDNGKEIRSEIIEQPIVISGIGNIVSFFAYPDSSYDLVANGDCVIQWIYNLTDGGVLQGIGLIATVHIGAQEIIEIRRRKNTMNYVALRAELDSNTVLYSPLNDIQAASEINTADKGQNKISMSRDEVINLIDPPALVGLTGDNATKVFGVLSEAVNPFGNAQQVFIDAFGAGSQTITNLAAARTETVSRGQQLGLGFVEPNDVTIARNL